MIKTIINKFPKSDVAFFPIPDSNIRNYSYYTKQEVDAMIAAAVDEAREIDRLSMRKHERDATIISMILGFTTLALFVDGLLRMLGIIPPFLDLDVNVLEKIAHIVENDVIDKMRQVPVQKLFLR